MLRYLGLSLLVLLAAGCVIPLNGWVVDEADYATFSETEPPGEESVLDTRLELDIGRLEIEPGSSEHLYEIEMRYNQLAFSPRVDFDRSGSTAHLFATFDGQGSSFQNLGENSMNLRVNPTTALRLEAITGVGESNIDLTGTTISELSLQTGVGETVLSMLEPNLGECDRISVTSGVGSFELAGLGNFGFRHFRFQGGVGGSKLDFSGDWDRIGEVVIEVGVGGVELLLPPHIGAEIRVHQGFFSGLDLEGFRKEGDTYYSENLDQVSKVVRFEIKAGMGGVSVDWM